jgi:predicted RNA-binding protein with PUA-like domain
MNYWLMKSEPSEYSIDDLQKDGKTMWDGVRNYQARNFMRDTMRVGDVVFIYHSNTKEPGIVGVGTVCSDPYPDPTAFDPQDPYYDPKSIQEKPTWFLIDVCFVKKFTDVFSLVEMKKDPRLENMRVLQRGNRLSVMPVEIDHGVYLLKKLS